MNTLNQGRSKTALKVLLFVAATIYLLLPLYLYAFTPMGPAVALLIDRTLNGDKPAQTLVSTAPLGVIQAQAAPSPTSANSQLPYATPSKDQPVADQLITVLLLGYGGPGHDGPYLSDTLILAIVDPKHKSLSFLSIPRDTLVKLPLDQQGGILSKINTAYAYGREPGIYTQRPARYKAPQGGGLLAKDTVAGITGLPVQYYVALDFNAFRKFIDEIGGLDVNVPAAFAALYPRNDNPAIDDEWMVVRFKAGKEHMSGDRALQYARAREAIENLSEGSDFARSRRQRQIMELFKDKVMSPGGLVHLPGLLGIAKERVDTDLGIPSLGQMQKLLTDWKGLRITEAALTSENYLTSDGSTENGYYLSPVAGQNNWSQIQAFAQVLVSDPDLAEEMARTKVVIRNGSGKPEKGKELRAKLIAQGFNVAPLETLSLQPATRIEDSTDGGVPNLIKAITAALGDVSIPVQHIASPSPKVIIVLGQ